MYAKIINQKVVEYPIVNIRQAFPSTSFPEEILDKHLPSGIVRVHNSEFPQFNASTHKVVQRSLPELVNGQWQTTFDVVELSATELAELAVIAREQAKAQRQIAVNNIVVTTQAGHAFDGDETSQTRMTRAILAMQATGSESINWVLADNSVIQATIAELTEALALAGAEQSRLWPLLNLT